MNAEASLLRDAGDFYHDLCQEVQIGGQFATDIGSRAYDFR